MAEKDGEDYGYAAFVATIDTITIGGKTYDYVVKEISQLNTGEAADHCDESGTAVQ